MIVVKPAIQELETGILSLYSARDPALGNWPVVIFYGPSTTTNSSLSSSRIQAHIYSIAGWQSYPRLTISPTSPLYAAVEHLPSEKQGEETCRGLAVSLLRYFSEIPTAIQGCLIQAGAGGSYGTTPVMFEETHAGILAGRMMAVDNKEEIRNLLATALQDQCVSWIDVDVVLPRGSIRKVEGGEEFEDDVVEGGRPWIDYGKYRDLVKTFGSPTFLPTTKLKRAPSKPTAMSKTTAMMPGQRDNIRRQMHELLETEQRYVVKMNDLTNNLAAHVRRRTTSRTYQTPNANQNAAYQLFPPSLDRITSLNNEFMEAICLMLNQHEEDPQAQHIREAAGSISARSKDNTGTEALSKVLLDWFPRFKEPYQDYLRSSTEFPRILNAVLTDRTSSLSQKLLATGEQKLRALLIEPVQRLPRYSLFIDSILQDLPSTHSSVSKLLRAKDLIVDICALDNDGAHNDRAMVARLEQLITSWPRDIVPDGRLITAVDVDELSPPYFFRSSDVRPGMLLLFRNIVVLLRKSNAAAISARGMMSHLDQPTNRPLPNPADPAGNGTSKDLILAEAYSLHDTRFTEMHSGHVLTISSVARVAKTRGASALTDGTDTRVYRLHGSYEGKASRWCEEAVRAMIEHRYPEVMRDSDKWALRSLPSESNGLGILAAIFEAESSITKERRLCKGRIQMLIDRDCDQAPFPADDVDITACITILESNQMTVRWYVAGETILDTLGLNELSTLIARRVAQFLGRLHTLPEVDHYAQINILQNRKLLGEILTCLPIEDQHSRRFRPLSPVKALSSFLGASLKDSFAQPKQLRMTPQIDDSLGLFHRGLVSRSNSHLSISGEVSQTKGSSISASEANPKDSIGHLEETLNAYIVALRSRSGNVVGKVLRARAGADELRINELYNTLLEDPTQLQTAAEASVDILFAAFEKFLQKAWTERIGHILSPSALAKIQTVLSTSRGSAATEQLRNVLSEMSPQNSRAFTAMIRLLADLSEASGNDGDRGALIATFAEALISGESAHDHINLLDRLTDDFESLFEDSSSGEMNTTAQAGHAMANGSMSSNTSSFRRRFGLGNLTRENSKSETESRVGYVWRTLSKKSSEAESQPSSLSKSFLSRSRSTDADARKLTYSRPTSRDRPTSVTSSQDASQSRPGSAHNAVSDLMTIGESTAETFAPRSKKKRRSSLSDLTVLNGATIVPLANQDPTSPSTPGSAKRMYEASRGSLRTPSPTKQQRYGVSSPGTRPLEPPSRKENSPLATKITLGERSVNRTSDEVVVNSFSPKKRLSSSSHIPSLKNGPLQTRPSPTANSNVSPKKPPTSPRKLRIQNPQKLRERILADKKTLDNATPALQAELVQIGNELAAVPLHSDISLPLPLPFHARGTKTTTNGLRTSNPITIINSNSNNNNNNNNNTQPLPARLTALETQLTNLSTSLSQRTALLTADLDTTLTHSERKCRALDALYREANAENEALYDRFNDELARVLQGVRAGEGAAEMRRKLGEGQAEAAALRKEVARLRREVVGLRSLVREG